MAAKSTGYWVLMGLAILFMLLGAATLVPSASASEECLLGYKAFCTFVPISSVLCLVFAVAFLLVGKRKTA